MKNKVEFDLMQNAIDSIEHAIDLLAYGDELDQSTKYKRAILSISQAIELLLKERLRQIHPSLIWENIDRYPDVEAKTVSSDKALHRLRRIGGLIITEEDENLLRTIRRSRNAIEHYKWSISNKNAEFILGSSLSFVLFFSKNYIGRDLMGYAYKRDGILDDLLSSNPHFLSSFNKRETIEYLSQIHATGACEFCKAVLEKDEVVCSRCGHWNSVEHSDIPDFF